MTVKVDTRLVTATAICDNCSWRNGDRDSPDKAKEHTRSTGHGVRIYAHSIINVSRVR